MDLGGGCSGCVPPPPLGLSNITGIWFTGVQVKHGAPLTEKNPGSAPPSLAHEMHQGLEGRADCDLNVFIDITIICKQI